MRTLTAGWAPARAARASGFAAVLVVVVVLVGAVLAGCDAQGDDSDGAGVTVTEVNPTVTSAAASSSSGGSASRPASPSHPTSSAGTGGQPAGGATPPYCGAGRDVEEIVVEQWSTGVFRISLRPSADSRKAPRDATTRTLWSAIQGCVGDLGGARRADSLHEQLACHQALAQVRSRGGGYATGDTYDLESWRPPMDPNTFATWITTRCGNTLGTDPSGPPTRVYRPDGVAPQHAVRGEHN
ncbi:exported hypothetical protein [Frankia sp. AiPs1]|uniref:DUF2599 domain-containing protein n=1 Tax=Frankia sp. AiPa1 TaxID=573492 RepID=UPI00202B4A6D|nr:DUF2599 domain-containing protein [Frankia sp. AiPa1]MCL9758823.1 DUF2599 domain-containing protein [Frankia sp. AiPa1]